MPTPAAIAYWPSSEIDEKRKQANTTGGSHFDVLGGPPGRSSMGSCATDKPSNRSSTSALADVNAYSAHDGVQVFLAHMELHRRQSPRGGPALRDRMAAWLRWILGLITPPISPRCLRSIDLVGRPAAEDRVRSIGVVVVDPTTNPRSCLTASLKGIEVDARRRFPFSDIPRQPSSLPSRARARLGGAMLLDLLDRPGRCSGSWPQDSMVRSPAAPSPIPL